VTVPIRKGGKKTEREEGGGVGMTEHFTPIRKMFGVNYYSIPNNCTCISSFSVIIVYFIVFFSEIILGLNNCNYNHVMEKPTINYYTK
jgi:hypothetical protein